MCHDKSDTLINFIYSTQGVLLEELRIPGVLQRLALCYFTVAIPQIFFAKSHIEGVKFLFVKLVIFFADTNASFSSSFPIFLQSCNTLITKLFLREIWYDEHPRLSLRMFCYTIGIIIQSFLLHNWCLLQSFISTRKENDTGSEILLTTGLNG